MCFGVLDTIATASEKKISAYEREVGAGALFGPILRAGGAKKGVPPVMHDLIIFRALFSDSIPLRFY